LIIQAEGKVAIDLPAGPSELAILADTSAQPEYLAADLLSQAEHGVDSQVVLVSDNESILRETEAAVRQQLDALPRKTIAEKALANSLLVKVDSLQEGMDLLNDYAPEHLILQTRYYTELVPLVKHAGSVFLGQWACETLGDYISGTNHTLPTGGAARAYQGLSLAAFQKSISFQHVEEEGLKQLGPSAMLMAREEGLEAHAQAIAIRLKPERT